MTFLTPLVWSYKERKDSFLGCLFDIWGELLQRLKQISGLLP